MSPPGIKYIVDMIRVNLIDDSHNTWETRMGIIIKSGVINSGPGSRNVYLPSEVREAYREVFGFVPVTKVKVGEAERLCKIYNNSFTSRLKKIKILLTPIPKYQNEKDEREKEEYRKRGIIVERSGDKNFPDDRSEREYRALLEKGIDLTKSDTKTFEELYMDYLVAVSSLR